MANAPNSNGGMPPTSPTYGGGNRTPSNPRPGPVTVDPRTAPRPQAPTPLTAPNNGRGAVTRPLPTPATLSPDRGIKPL